MDVLHRERTELDAAGDAHHLVRSDERVHHLELGADDHRLLSRDVSALTQTRPVALVQRHHRGDRGVKGRVQPRLPVRHAHRCPIAIAVERHLTAGGGDREVGGEPARLRAVATERGDRHHHQGGVQSSQTIEVDVDRTAFDEHVGAGGEGVELTGISHDDRPLATVERPMGQRAFRIDHVTGEGSLVTRPLTVGRFDRDHIGAELGQDVSGELAPIIAEIKDSIGREHSSPYRPDDSARLSMFAIPQDSATPTTNVPAPQRGASVYDMTGRVTISLPVIAVAARECDVPGCSWRGLPNEGIAYQLGISAKTVGNHVERIYRSPGVEPGRRCDARHAARLVRSTAAPVD